MQLQVLTSVFDFLLLIVCFHFPILHFDDVFILQFNYFCLPACLFVHVQLSSEKSEFGVIRVLLDAFVVLLFNVDLFGDFRAPNLSTTFGVLISIVFVRDFDVVRLTLYLLNFF